MDFKQMHNGSFIVSFIAEELPIVVRAVKAIEINRLEELKQNTETTIKSIAEAEEAITS